MGIINAIDKDTSGIKW